MHALGAKKVSEWKSERARGGQKAGQRRVSDLYRGVVSACVECDGRQNAYRLRRGKMRTNQRRSCVTSELKWLMEDPATATQAVKDAMLTLWMFLSRGGLYSPQRSVCWTQPDISRLGARPSDDVHASGQDESYAEHVQRTFIGGWVGDRRSTIAMFDSTDPLTHTPGLCGRILIAK